MPWRSAYPPGGQIGTSDGPCTSATSAISAQRRSPLRMGRRSGGGWLQATLRLPPPEVRSSNLGAPTAELGHGKEAGRGRREVSAAVLPPRRPGRFRPRRPSLHRLNIGLEAHPASPNRGAAPVRRANPLRSRGSAVSKGKETRHVLQIVLKVVQALTKEDASCAATHCSCIDVLRSGRGESRRRRRDHPRVVGERHPLVPISSSSSETLVLRAARVMPSRRSLVPAASCPAFVALAAGRHRSRTATTSASARGGTEPSWRSSPRGCDELRRRAPGPVGDPNDWIVVTGATPLRALEAAMDRSGANWLGRSGFQRRPE